MSTPPSQSNKRLKTSLVIGVIFLVIVLLLVVSGIVYFASRGSSSAVTPGTTPTTAPTQGTTPTPVPAAFTITGITMAVNPQSIAGMACGTPITVVYTATFHSAPNGPGGTTQFTYNTDDGWASTPGSLTFAPGETTKTFAFKWVGTLLADHTFPAAGGVNVTSPNVVNTSINQPTGTCIP